MYRHARAPFRNCLRTLYKREEMKIQLAINARGVSLVMELWLVTIKGFGQALIAPVENLSMWSQIVLPATWTQVTGRFHRRSRVQVHLQFPMLGLSVELLTRQLTSVTNNSKWSATRRLVATWAVNGPLQFRFAHANYGKLRTLGWSWRMAQSTTNVIADLKWSVMSISPVWRLERKSLNQDVAARHLRYRARLLNWKEKTSPSNWNVRKDLN